MQGWKNLINIRESPHVVMIINDRVCVCVKQQAQIVFFREGEERSTTEKICVHIKTIAVENLILYSNHIG